MIKAVIFDLDGVLVDARELHYIALNRALEAINPQYQISRDEHLSTFDGLPTSKKLEFLRELGCKVNPYVSVHHSLDSVCNAWQEWEERRSHENYWIDGVVVKMNDVEVQRRLGYTGKSPRWALALKFAPEEATTVVKDVTYQVGRTGKITPVAVFEPAEGTGTTCS